MYREGSVRVLRLLRSEQWLLKKERRRLIREQWQPPGSAHRLPSGIIAAVLLFQAASLRELRLDCAAANIGEEDGAALAALTGLEKLTIVVAADSASWCWGDRAERVIRDVSRLPALQLLEISIDNINPEPGHCLLPTVHQLSELQIPSLRVMSWRMDSIQWETLALCGLQALESCTLGWVGLAEVHLVDVVADSFRGSPGLTQLTLTNHDGLQLAPHCLDGLSKLVELNLSASDLSEVPSALLGVGRTLRRLELCNNFWLSQPAACFNGLTALEELSLAGCRLTAVSEALSGVKGTLRRLDLSGNGDLQLDQAGFSTLLALAALEWLDISGADRMTDVSKGFAAQILGEWQKLHPGLPPLTLKC